MRFSKNNKLLLLSYLFASQQALASSAWVPISNGDITSIIPVPKVEVNGTNVYTTGDNMKILLGDIGATSAYYYQLIDSQTGALGPLQCTTAETAKAQGNTLLASPGVTSGSYKFRVSACMTGVGCDVAAFEKGNLACSEFGSSNQFTYNSVSGIRTPSVSDSTNEYIGTTQLQFRVSESGAATYTVPISIPNGSGGVQPQVSLFYSSQAGSGHLGHGWSLNAGSAISRCGKTPVYDGVQGGVSLTKNDRLCFNGQRLLLNSSTSSVGTDVGVSNSDYWSETATYHTAIDSFSVITPYYSDSELKAFTVENKAGEIHYFGDVGILSNKTPLLKTKSRATLRNTFKKYKQGETTGNTDAYLTSVVSSNLAHTWLIKAVEDVMGSYFVYNYSTFDVSNGESYLTSIDYTGSNNQRPFASVIFNYKNDRKKFLGWSAGSPIQRTQLIKDITVEIDGKMYRQYTPSYFESDFLDEKTYLEELRECTLDYSKSISSPDEICNAPLSFKWQKPDPITSEIKTVCPKGPNEGGLVTDGESFHPEFYECFEQVENDPFTPFKSSSSKYISAENLGSSVLIDFNGDGYTDILYPDGEWKVKYGPNLSTAVTIDNSRPFTSEEALKTVKVIDYNGDGQLDLLAAKEEGQNWHIITHKKITREVQNCNSGYEYERRPDSCYTYTISMNVNDLGIKAIGAESRTQIMDINGDALQDIVYTLNNELFVYENTGSNFELAKKFATVPEHQVERYNDEETIEITTSLTSSNSLYKNTAGAVNSLVLDFNGDGITDLLIARKTTVKRCHPTDSNDDVNRDAALQESGDLKTTSEPNCWPEGPHFAWYLYSGANWSEYTQKFNYIDFSNPKVVDLNGDGLSDIVWRSGEKIKYRLSSGRELLEPQVAQYVNSNSTISDITFKEEQEESSYFMDVSADGRTDLLISNNAGTHRATYFSRPILGAPEKVLFENRGSFAFSKDTATQFADINADGQLDWLQSNDSFTSWEVRYSTHKDELMHVIYESDNGHGVTNRINYDSINVTEDNIPLNRAAVNILSDSSLRFNNDGTTNNDYVAPKTGLFVVSGVLSKTNIKTSANITTSEYASVIYQYGGLLMHKKGYGNLGFELLRTLDLQTCKDKTVQFAPSLNDEDDDDTGNIDWGELTLTDFDNCVTTTTMYNQAAPFIGMPKSTIKTLGVGSDSILLSKSTNEYNTKETINGGQQVYLSKSTDFSYALNKDLSSSKLVSRTITTQEQDTYGNVTESNVVVDNLSEGATSSLHYSKVNTSNSYGTTAIDKRMGRLSLATVTKSYKTTDVTDSITQIASFTYNGNKLLESETTALGKTTHTYDDWGNKVESTLVVNDSSGTVNDTRKSSLEYDTRGRYVIYTTNAKEFVTTNKYLTTGSNGNFTTSPTGRVLAIETHNEVGSNVKKYLNGFGVAYKTVSNTGSQSPTLVSQTFTSPCSSVTCGVSGAYQRVISAASGVPESHTYLDAWGRELQTKKRLMDGSWQVVAKFYDAQGRAEWVSEPNKNSVSGNKTSFEYDRIGRVKKETKPDGSTVTHEYDGLQTITTDAKGNKLRVINNFAGHKTAVENLASNDAVLTKLTYVYDANNNLLNSKVYTGSTYSHTQSTLTYDDYGRKKSMTDLDKGNWTYAYNGFGELVSQTNSSNQTVQLRYDELGRKIARLDVDGLTCWEYDTELQGKLSRVAYKKGSGQSTNTCSTSNWPSNPNYQEQYTYGHNHQLASTTTTIDGEAFHTQVMYDEFNRVKYTQYPANGFTVEHGYNSLGMPTTLKNVTEGHRDFGKIYQEVKATDARGNVTDVRYANGVKQTKGHNAQTGYIEAMSLTKGNSVLHNQNFKFDALGYLEERKHNFGYGGSAHDYCETFGYDNLNRLDWSRTKTGTTACSTSSGIYKNYNYDALGNFRYKAGAGYYTYHNSIKNRVLKVTSGANGTGTTVYNFSKYDNRGNVLNDGSRTFTYTSYDKPSRITKGSIATDMSYDHGRNLYRRVDHRSDGITDTLYVKGLYERVKGSNGVTEHKYYVGNTVVTDRSNGKHDTLYLHKDHLGSTTSITNASGAVVQHINYDAWGEQNRFHTSGNLSTLLQQQSPAESKGYTGHKELSDLGIIHMNGRIYDPTLGRFVQADPFIQFPNNSQSYNRYSYVLNNPMSFTDPTGYFSFSGFLKQSYKRTMMIDGRYTAHKFTGRNPALHSIGVTALNFIPYFGPLAAAHANFDHALVNTGSLRAAFTSGATSLAISGVFYGIGQAFDASSGFWQTGGAAHIGAHALAGGVISDLQGGNFGHGFFSAGFSKFAMGNAGFNYDDVSAGAIAGRTIIAAVIGGTASVISGGKFANGAQTAAMAQLFNQEASNFRKRFKFSFTGDQSPDSYVNNNYREGKLQVSARTSYKGFSSEQVENNSTITGVSNELSLSIGTKFGPGVSVYNSGKVEVSFGANFENFAAKGYIDSYGTAGVEASANISIAQVYANYSSPIVHNLNVISNSFNEALFRYSKAYSWSK
ncbi:RHS repeat-associated core domain-containing protein [Pseudoalteromonas phenolica]|uniref:RHS repeat-associated core domain-containing protein n=1 Tax=Pseudoalteromonas phenolica TaxID=161398 RepID=UPI00110BC9FD|nr:RHS repeat-associated core domain-containing protein [Pseudoalteromonas phenolica]TMO54658.1 hypothetical protein CWC21_14895 [Pseudoalteromonas phenolica]